MSSELRGRLLVVDRKLVEVKADQANLVQRLASLARVRASLEAERREIQAMMKEGGPTSQDVIDLADASDADEVRLSGADEVVAIQRDNADAARVAFCRSVSGGRYGACEDEAAARRLAADMKLI